MEGLVAATLTLPCGFSAHPGAPARAGRKAPHPPPCPLTAAFRGSASCRLHGHPLPPEWRLRLSPAHTSFRTVRHRDLGVYWQKHRDAYARHRHSPNSEPLWPQILCARPWPQQPRRPTPGSSLSRPEGDFTPPVLRHSHEASTFLESLMLFCSFLWIFFPIYFIWFYFFSMFQNSFLWICSRRALTPAPGQGRGQVTPQQKPPICSEAGGQSRSFGVCPDGLLRPAPPCPTTSTRGSWLADFSWGLGVPVAQCLEPELPGDLFSL